MLGILRIAVATLITLPLWSLLFLFQGRKR
jgi:hypothetical protein